VETVKAVIHRDSVLDDLGSLAQKIRGSGSLADFHRVVLGLVYLHKTVPWQLVRLATDSPELDDAQVSLQRVAQILRAALNADRLPTTIASALSAIRPDSRHDVVRLIDLTRELPAQQFERFVRQMESGWESGGIGPVTPTTVASLMARLGRADGMHVGVVYDPCSRAGELLTPALRRYGSIDIYADSPRADLLALTGMNLRVQGARGVFREEYAPWVRADRQEFADVVLSNPPFNATGGALGRYAAEFVWPFGTPPSNSQNFAWLQHAVTSLRPNGRAAVLMPPSTLWSGVSSEVDIRTKMIEAGVVHCIITLPKNMFNSTAVAPVAWILRPPGEAGDHVLFIRADQLGKRVGRKSELSPEDLDAIVKAYRRYDQGGSAMDSDAAGISMTVPLAAIRENRGSLNPGDYQRKIAGQGTTSTVAESFSQAQADLARLCDYADAAAGRACAINRWWIPPAAGSSELPRGWRRLLLRDICEIQAGPSSSRLRSTDRSPYGSVPVVMPKHLRDGRILPIDNELVSQRKADSLDRFRLQANDLLCVRTGSLGKVAVVCPSENGWIQHTNLMRLRIRAHTEVESRYLMAYLTQNSIRRWINDRATAASPVPSLSTDALGELNIEVPPLHEQMDILQTLDVLSDQTAAYEKLARAAAEYQAQLAQHLLRGGLTVR
jgi:type I restriction enzyme M protein